MRSTARAAGTTRRIGLGICFSISLAFTVGPPAPASAATPSSQSEPAPCPTDNGGITLSPGFCATVFADNLGHVRHMDVGPDGVLVVNIWSGRYYARTAPPADGFLVALQDTNGDGVADVIKRFGQTVAEGSAGGTGVRVYDGFVYAEANDRIVRYALKPGSVAPSGKPETVVSGLPLNGDHPMHPFVIDAKGQLFIDVATATNSCQPENRVAEVPGAKPCTELQTRGGIWRYSADKLGQVFSPAGRYATGIRNAEGLSFDDAGRLFATQHGRDQLLQNWPSLYPDAEKTVELPSEELVVVKEGGDYGWPTCYYDGFQHKLVLAPEYGGNGGRAVGVCADKIAPVAAYPGHWAPNDMTLYQGDAFPAAARGGAFIAFHGSWNRSPGPQGGYNVVFQPLKDGQASGPYVIFADGFAGASKGPGQAAYRPTGLAVAPDGALFIADDVKGRIWRVTYRGGPIDTVAAAPAPTAVVGSAGMAPRASAVPLATPPGATAGQVLSGQRLYSSSTCVGCHGADAKGTPLGPDLTSSTHLWIDGSLSSIDALITKGVSAPKQFRAPMPPLGGAQLSSDDVASLSAYVWAVGHKSP